MSDFPRGLPIYVTYKGRTVNGLYDVIDETVKLVDLKGEPTEYRSLNQAAGAVISTINPGASTSRNAKKFWRFDVHSDLSQVLKDAAKDIEQLKEAMGG